MPSEPKRKLAAIMFTDMVGYTALMQEDEDKARELIERHRDLMKPHVDKHGGEIIQYVGDGTFCRFDSAKEAVTAALEIQHVFELEDDMSLRIGIHVGDVVVKGDEVYGDGVNVASRLEPLADPGGICLSGEVYTQIKNQANIDLIEGGSKDLKNVKDPVDIYFVGTSSEKVFSAPGKAVKSEKSNSRKFIYAGAAVMVLLLVIMWNLPFFSSGDRVLEASGEIRSIAVLPLDNMSNDPDQEYFSDGMTEALITNIAKIRALKVISRTSVMRYKGTKKSLPEIAKELKVDAILEGSVMHAEGAVRITAQLIRASTDEHLWANSYTDKLENILSLQSRIARTVADEIKLTLSPEEEMNIGGERKVNPAAYDLYLQAKKIDPWVMVLENETIAIELLQEAVAIDENFIEAWTLLSDRISILQFVKRDNDRDRIGKARQAIDKAKELDPTKIEVQLAEGHYYYYGNKDLIKGLEIYYGVLRNDPNNSIALEHVGYVLRRMGKWDAALEKFMEVYRSDPYNADLVRSIAENYFYLRNFSKAEIYFKKALDIAPTFAHPYVTLGTIAFQKSGDPKDGLAAMETEFKVNHRYWTAGLRPYFLALTGNLSAANEELNALPATVFVLGDSINIRNFFLGVVHNIVGEKTKADGFFNSIVSDLEIAYRLDPKNGELMAYLSYAYAYLGRKEEAISVAQSRVENLPISDDAYWGATNQQGLAEIYMLTGENGKALILVEKLLSVPSEMSVEALRVWPVWKPLHELPRYKEIIKKYGPGV